MEKEILHLEYVFDRVSLKSLWRNLSTPEGLQEWLANNVSKDEDIYTFDWGANHIERVKAVELSEGERIRYIWLKHGSKEINDAEEYFEFAIHNMEITGGKALEVTDFAFESDRPSIIELWDNQIDQLRKSLGVSI